MSYARVNPNCRWIFYRTSGGSPSPTRPASPRRTRRQLFPTTDNRQPAPSAFILHPSSLHPSSFSHPHDADPVQRRQPHESLPGRATGSSRPPPAIAASRASPAVWDRCADRSPARRNAGPGWAWKPCPSVAPPFAARQFAPPRRMAASVPSKASTASTVAVPHQRRTWPMSSALVDRAVRRGELHVQPDAFARHRPGEVPGGGEMVL